MDVFVFLLMDEWIGILVNIIVNIGFMFMVILGNVLIFFSFVFELFLCIIVNYFLFGLVLIDFGVGFVVYLLYIFVMLSVYDDFVLYCIILVIYSILVFFLVGVLFFYIVLIGLDRCLVICLYLWYR